MIEIANKLRELRESKGLTLKQVSKDTGFSISFLSRFENNKSSITLSNLSKLLKYYDTTLAEIVSERSPSPVMKPEDRKHLWDNVDGVHAYLLVPDLNRLIEVMLMEFEPGAEGGSLCDPVHHEGEEFIMVLEGAIELNLDGDKNYRMETGDTAYYNGQRMHCWRNVSGEKSVMLKVLTPPYGLER